MSRTLTGTFTGPLGSALANTLVNLVATRSELAKVVKGTSESFTTDGAGAYSVVCEPGYYKVLFNIGGRVIPVGHIMVETDATPTDINFLLAANGTPISTAQGILDDAVAEVAKAAAEVVNAQSEVANAQAEVVNAQAEVATANQHKLDAEAAKVAAQASEAAAATSEANAAAVVTGGTATAAPAAGKIPLADSQGKIDLDWLLPVQTKAEFDAARANRKQQFAGSGFVEWGKHNSANNAINEGMYDRVAVANNLLMGRADGLAVGASRTDAPLVAIDGVLLSIDGVNDSIASQSVISLPDAPIATNLFGDGDLNDAGNWTFSGTTPGWSLSGGKLIQDGTGSSDSEARYTVDVPLIVGKEYLLEIIFDAIDGDDGAKVVAMNAGGIVPDADVRTIQSASINNVKTQVYSKKFIADSATKDFQIYARNGASCTISAVSVVDLAEVNRTDLVFLEAWHEKISDKDVVYPYGNVQFGTATWDGITLSNTVEVQGYSAFGDWDTVTKGYGVIWSTLSAADKAKFVQDPENNIYLDDGELIQVRYRVRAVKGLGDDWENVDSATAEITLAYDDFTINSLQAQGSSATVPAAFGSSGTRDVFLHKSITNAIVKDDVGIFSLDDRSVGLAHKGLCFAIPLALVKRRNQGAYHNVLNERGCDLINKDDGWGGKFYQTNLAGWQGVETTYECFSNRPVNSDYGFIASTYPTPGNPQGRFYDAIYADDIQDLRNRAVKPTDLNRTLDKYFQKAVAGELRGSEKVKRLGKVATAKSVGGNAFFHNGGPNPTIYTNADYEEYDWTQVKHGDRFALYEEGTSNILVGHYGGGTLGASDLQIVLDYESGMPVSGTQVQGGQYKFVYLVEEEAKSSGEILHCDIIGDPANYFRGHYTYLSSTTNAVNTGEVIKIDTLTTGAGTVGNFYERTGGNLVSTDLQTVDYTVTADWKDLGTDRPGSWVTDGVFGTPLLAHPDTGVSLIPDGTSKTFKMSRKVQNVELVIYSADNGNTWTTTTAWDAGIEGSGNAHTASPSASVVHLVFYTTKANGWESASNSEVLALGDVWAGHHNLTTLGNALIPALIGKVPVSAGAGVAVSTGYKADSYRIDTHTAKELATASDYAPTHSAINLNGEVGPAAKALPYLTRENNRLYLQTLFKEMKYDSSMDVPNEANNADSSASVAYTAGQYYYFNAGGRKGESYYCVSGNTLTVDTLAEISNGDLVGVSSGSVYFKRWDGNGWGDDNKFNVIDDVSTSTDDNSATVLVGQKRIELPFFISDEV